MKHEFNIVWDIVEKFYGTFGFSDMKVRLSLHDPAEFQKYLGTPEQWQVAEDTLRTIAKERNADTFDGIGEAAFYGPKLDFMATDSLGRQWQVATIQLDMNLPERFDLTCVNEKGEHERIVMIHAAITGAIERFMAIMLEHLNGVLPTWLSPVQAKVIPIADTHQAFAKEVLQALKDAGIRAEVDESSETLGKKSAKQRRTKSPTCL